MQCICYRRGFTVHCVHFVDSFDKVKVNIKLSLCISRRLTGRLEVCTYSLTLVSFDKVINVVHVHVVKEYCQHRDM
jgi:acetolactate synthase regulatory subunit